MVFGLAVEVMNMIPEEHLEQNHVTPFISAFPIRFATEVVRSWHLSQTTVVTAYHDITTKIFGLTTDTTLVSNIFWWHFEPQTVLLHSF